VKQQTRELLYGAFVGAIVCLIAIAAFVLGE
jgi:hypothetical protein